MKHISTRIFYIGGSRQPRELKYTCGLRRVFLESKSIQNGGDDEKRKKLCVCMHVGVYADVFYKKKNENQQQLIKISVHLLVQ